jgi:hypothetical protein
MTPNHKNTFLKGQFSAKLEHFFRVSIAAFSTKFALFSGK